MLAALDTSCTTYQAGSHMLHKDSQHAKCHCPCISIKQYTQCLLDYYTYANVDVHMLPRIPIHATSQCKFSAVQTLWLHTIPTNTLDAHSQHSTYELVFFIFSPMLLFGFFFLILFSHIQQRSYSPCCQVVATMFARAHVRYVAVTCPTCNSSFVFL